MIDISDIDIVDFHSHPPKNWTISQFVDAGEEPRELFGKPGTHQTSYLRYLARVYKCKPTIDDVDKAIARDMDKGFCEYVRSVLDRERIAMVNLDFFGGKRLNEMRTAHVRIEKRKEAPFKEDFPQDRYKWTYGTTPIIQPIWAKEKDAANLDQVIDLVDRDIDEAVKLGCAAFKSMIGYYRTLSIERVDQDEAGKAYKELLTTEPARYELTWNAKVPVYEDPEAVRSLKIYQDFLTRHLMIKAGDLRRPFIFHVAAIDVAGCDHRNVNPANLFSIFYDEEVMKTNIVMLHAGYPFYQQAAVIPYQFAFSANNIYLDLSFVIYYQPVYRDIFKNVVTLTPVDRLLYGSDAYGMAEKFGWAAWWARRLMTYVFEELIDKYGWTEEDCRQIAEMVLNKNAKRLLAI